jgi:hypothetical protein
MQTFSVLLFFGYVSAFAYILATVLLQVMNA